MYHKACFYAMPQPEFSTRDFPFSPRGYYFPLGFLMMNENGVTGSSRSNA